VVSEIEKLAEFLLHEGTKLCGEMAALYEAAAMNIRSHAFEKGNWIFQLAYVVTPAGRKDARHRHLHAPILAISPPKSKPGDDDPDDDEPRAHVGFVPLPKDLDLDGEEQNDLLQLPEDEEEPTEEALAEEESDDEFPEVDAEQFRLDLWRHTEDGLKDIMV
jgi:hypothetical protein